MNFLPTKDLCGTLQSFIVKVKVFSLHFPHVFDKKNVCLKEKKRKNTTVGEQRKNMQRADENGVLMRRQEVDPGEGREAV